MPFRRRRSSNADASSPTPLPFPPHELRELVGTTSDDAFDNPTGAPVFNDVDSSNLDVVLDWGCGCGRLARQLMQQTEQPGRYVGVDLHRGMIDWCSANLAPLAEQFSFHHHDVLNPGLNPHGTEPFARFPVDDGTVGLFVAWSVFTHVNEQAANFYLGEVARVLRAGGVAKTTWFLFDKRYFPMMQEDANALFVSDGDPTAAVIFSREWLLAALTAHGLVVRATIPPRVRGFQWHIEIVPASDGLAHIELPADSADFGIVRPPMMPEHAERLG